MHVYHLRAPAVGKEVELKRKLSYGLRLPIASSLGAYEVLLDALTQIVTSVIVRRIVPG